MSLYTARFVGLPYWKEDQHKRGFVWVDYLGEVLKAYPKNGMMSLAIPSIEWVTKYKDLVWCLLEHMEDDSRYWAWVGVAVLKPEQAPSDEIFQLFFDQYPYVRFWFSENWKLVCEDMPGETKLRILHEDATELVIDRTPQNELFRFVDGTVGHKIIFDRDQFAFLHGVHKHEILGNEEMVRITHGPEGHTVQLDEDGITVEAKGGARVRIKKSGDVELSGGKKRGVLEGVVTASAPVDFLTGCMHGALASKHVKATKT